jgi:hypothetical protein
MFIFGDSMRDKLRRTFELDFRSLSLFRVCISVVILVDVWQRLGDLDAFYVGDGGALGSERFVPPSNHLCLHCVSGSYVAQLCLFALQIVAALALLVGYRTRAATLVSFLLVTSLHTYFPVVLNGGDDVLRLFLFWSLFLPLDGAFAVDDGLRRERRERRRFADALEHRDADDANDKHAAAAQRRAASSKSRADFSVSSFASCGFVLNLMLVYLIAAATKTGDDWLNGTAVFNALYMIDYATPFAVALRQQVTLMRLLSPLALLVEVVAPLCYVVPFRFEAMRLLGIVLLVGLHVSFLLTLRVGIFPLACIACHLALLPSSFWFFVASTLAGATQRNTKLIYDADRPLVARTLQLAKSFLLSYSTELFPALAAPTSGDSTSTLPRLPFLRCMCIYSRDS